MDLKTHNGVENIPIDGNKTGAVEQESDANLVSKVGLVSVIMPAFNSERYIRGAIDSVLKQTYPFFELIVVDACSLPHRKEAVL